MDQGTPDGWLEQWSKKWGGGGGGDDTGSDSFTSFNFGAFGTSMSFELHCLILETASSVLFIKICDMKLICCKKVVGGLLSDDDIKFSGSLVVVVLKKIADGESENFMDRCFAVVFNVEVITSDE